MRDVYRVLLCLVKSNAEATQETKDSLLKLMMQQLSALQEQMAETIKNDSKNGLDNASFQFGTAKMPQEADAKEDNAGAALSMSYLIATGGSLPPLKTEGEVLAKTVFAEKTQFIANRMLYDFNDVPESSPTFPLVHPSMIASGRKAGSSLRLDITHLRALQAYAPKASADEAQPSAKEAAAIEPSAANSAREALNPAFEQNIHPKPPLHDHKSVNIRA